MRRWLEELEEFAIEVIFDRRKGKRATLLRGILRAASWLFQGLVESRLWLYRHRIFRENQLGCLVVSVGNITVGGTGKTPVVEKFARALSDGGRKVAILSRGYKSERPSTVSRFVSWITHKETFTSPPRVVADGENVLLDSRLAGDEPFMLARNLKNVVVLVDKDRVKSGRYAIEKFGADTLLLDDGLQYLRLRHRLDIVLVDCQAPFGTGHMLPRGTLREPPKNLKRASYIFLTKSPGGDLGELIAEIRRHNPVAEIVECCHRPLYLENAFTGERQPLAGLQGKTVAALSGIAAPESFERFLNDLGAKVEISRRFADHHRYVESELTSLIHSCVRRDLDAIVTTEKDAVRFPKMVVPKVPVYFLRVEVEILSGHETWQHCVDRICKIPSMIPPEQFF